MLDYTRLTETVDRAVSIAASNFPAHHDSSDIKQDCWVWIMENKNTVVRILSEENGVARLTNTLVKVANGAYKAEDEAVYGYDREDRFTYSVDLIKSILEVVFRHEDWQSFASFVGDGTPRAKSEPATSGNNLASYADVSRAVSKLPDDYYNIIVWRYKYGYTFTRIGEESGTTKQAASERHNRALKAIQALLGDQPLSELRKGWDGRTEARGNASSQARVTRDYDGA